VFDKPLKVAVEQKPQKPRDESRPAVIVILSMACVAILAVLWSAYSRAQDPPPLYEKVLFPSGIQDSNQIYDGDTIKDVMVKVFSFEEPLVLADGQAGEVWPGIEVYADGVYTNFDVRIAGIDTPEKRPRKKRPDGSVRPEADRDREKKLALKARGILDDILKARSYNFFLKNPEVGKYAGRLVCEVWVLQNRQPVDVSELLIEAGVARRYEGGTKEAW